MAPAGLPDRQARVARGCSPKACPGDLRSGGFDHAPEQEAEVAVGGRTKRHPAYGQSQRTRKRFDEEFGRMKTVEGFRTRNRGAERTGLAGYPLGTAYNLVQMSRLLTAQQTRAVQPA